MYFPSSGFFFLISELINMKNHHLSYLRCVSNNLFIKSKIYLLWRSVRRPALPSPPPGSVTRQICWAASGKEGPGEDWGGWDCLNHLLPPQILVCLRCARPSQAALGKIWRPRARCCRRRPQEEQCSPTREKVGSTEESRRPQHAARAINSAKRSFKNRLKCQT